MSYGELYSLPEATYRNRDGHGKSFIKLGQQESNRLLRRRARLLGRDVSVIKESSPTTQFRKWRTTFRFHGTEYEYSHVHTNFKSLVLSLPVT